MNSVRETYAMVAMMALVGFITTLIVSDTGALVYGTLTMGAMTLLVLFKLREVSKNVRCVGTTEN